MNCGAGVAAEERPSFEAVDPVSIMHAAADVVDAMAAAAGASGWLCVPSYVVIRIEVSSAHLCTCSVMHAWKTVKAEHVEAEWKD